MQGRNYIEEARRLVLENVDTRQYAVFLFGSRVFVKHPEKSDIDIGILGVSEFPEFRKYLIKEKIEESHIPYNVDIIDFYKADKSFKKVALRKIELWSKPEHIDIS